MTTTTERERAGHDLGRAISRYVNSQSSDASDAALVDELVCDHRTLQQRTVGILLTAILGFAENPTDDRNEAAVLVCQRVRDLLVKMETESAPSRETGLFAKRYAMSIVDGVVRFPFV